MHRKFLVGIICFAALGTRLCQAQPLTVFDLKSDYQTNPLGIDNPRPRLSWKLESTERGARQTAYEIVAASSPSKLKKGDYDLWDSGKVASDRSIGITYDGAARHSGEQMYWSVRAWNQNAVPSAFSKPAWLELGLLNATDWHAQWVSQPRARPLTEAQMFANDPAPLFRKEFTVRKKIRRARAYISGLGYYELALNGKRVGDHVLDPGWTDYSKRTLYSTYDVTDQVRRGRNAVGVMLGNGWYNPLPLRMWGHLNLRDQLTIGEPRVCAVLMIDYADGQTETIGTDESWKTAPGPILRNSVYLGEFHDARQEIPKWNRPGFDDSNWHSAVLATGPVGTLRAQTAPPIRITRSLKPRKITQAKPGVYIVDFGQNFAGWVRLHLRGPSGTDVRIRYGELLHPDGSLNGMTSVAGQIKQGGEDYRYRGEGYPKTAWQQDEYILKGGDEVFCPHFTFHGFRYAEITGLPSPPSPDDIEGLRLNSDVAPAGSFQCSNDEFNRIDDMVLWTQFSNLFSVESDCPHREKFGYGGDMVAASESEIFHFDMERFYAKAVQDLGDAARPNGGFTETAPSVGLGDEGLGGGSGPIGWGTAQPFVQWMLYQYYGDASVLAANYEATKRWIHFLESCAANNILDNGISDHESLVPKPRALTATAFYYLNEQLFARIADALGHGDDAKAANETAASIKAAFSRAFLKESTGAYDSGTQACQAFALYLGLDQPADHDRAMGVLTHDIVDMHQQHLTAGIFGTKFMLNVLNENGRADLAFQIVNQRSFPGWGYMLENGATTLWEHWAFSDNTYSHNHPMFGSVSEWFYKCLAGIRPDTAAVGFNRIIIAPQPVGDLKWVKARYESIHGPIVSEWTRDGQTFKLHTHIPIGATATVRLPDKKEIQVESGDYDFASTIP